MTTREGSRASRYGAKDAGSFGRAVSSALLTVDLFRPGFPPRPSVPAGSRRDVLQRHSFSGPPLYNVSHFTPVVTKASYNIDALDDAWYNAPPAGGTRRLVCKRFANRTRRHLAAR